MKTARAADAADAIAPDGSEVRLLVDHSGASMAEFTLAAGETSVAVAHRTLEEVWYVVAGLGEMWRRSEDTGNEEVVMLTPGTALSIPRRTHFQFRAGPRSPGPLIAVGTTVPAWPGIGEMSGRGEAYLVMGPWTATVEPGADLS